MPGSQSSIQARSVLRAAIAVTAARLVPGNGALQLRHLALIAESEPLTPPPTWTDASALTLSTQFSARALCDALGLGPGLVRRYFDGVRLRRPAQLSAGARAQLYSSVAEYCCALGWTHVGARFGAEAKLFADTPALHYRALATNALATAMNGDFSVASDEIARARRIFEVEGWPSSECSFSQFSAEMTVAASRGDASALRDIGRQMSDARPADPYWDFAAGVADVMARWFSGDVARGFALSTELLHGSRRHSSHRPWRLYLVCLQSDMLVARGEFGQALALLSGYESPEGHGVCFASQQSAALLHLRREHHLIAVTDACAANEADHNLRTLAPLLARRAVAFYRLDDERRALQSMESVVLMAGRAGRSILPYIMLPTDELNALLGAVAAARPALSDTVAEIRAALPQTSMPVHEESDPGRAARLTTTERGIADLFLTSLSISDIAEVRSVSVNTVKSQARSIYAKLGVSGRHEAVEVLRHSRSR